MIQYSTVVLSPMTADLIQPLRYTRCVAIIKYTTQTNNAASLRPCWISSKRADQRDKAGYKNKAMHV